MNLRRNTIASLMLVVVIVSLNLAVARVLEPWRLAGVGPIALAIEVGLFYLIRTRWTGKRSADDKVEDAAQSGPLLKI